MGIFEQLGMAEHDQAVIDWEITPALTFTIFESWGTKERVIKSKNERYYYFYIDGWQTPGKLCLMERGIKHARVMAEVEAPQEMIDQCMAAQGSVIGLDRSYAVDENLQSWLSDNVLPVTIDAKGIKVLTNLADIEEMETGLPHPTDELPEFSRVRLPHSSGDVSDDQIPGLVRSYDFFDSKYNPQGGFSNYLVDNGDGLTVTDKVTGVMWQRHGSDLISIRQMQRHTAELNKKSFAGYSDWRLPSIEEAASLLEPSLNDKGLYLHPCFSKQQPFIFLDGQRRPGGYWFIDCKQATVFWASGFNPGGFGRVCRTTGCCAE